MKIFVLAFVLILFLPAQSFAEENKFYTSIGTGVILSDEVSGFSALASLGVEVKNKRFELEYGYRNAGTGTSLNLEQNVTTHSFMGNGFYEFKETGFLLPYLGIGFGVALKDSETSKINGQDVNMEDSSVTIASQFMVGTTTEFTNKLSSDFEYRIFATDGWAAHGININLRYEF